MVMDTIIAVIQTTLNDRKTALRLAHDMIENGLAACVQILPGIVSVYRWRGICENSEEILLCIKTSIEKEYALCNWLQQSHPYELPEIIARQERTSKAYAAWVEAETSRCIHIPSGSDR